MSSPVRPESPTLVYDERGWRICPICKRPATSAVYMDGTNILDIDCRLHPETIVGNPPIKVNLNPLGFTREELAYDDWAREQEWQRLHKERGMKRYRHYLARTFGDDE